MTSSDTLMETVAAPLVDLGLRATLVLTVTWFLASILHRASASSRRAVWIGGLAATLILPVSMLFGPRLRIELPQAGPDAQTQRAVPNAASPIDSSLLASAVAELPPGDASTPTFDATSHAATPLVDEPPTQSVNPGSPVRPSTAQASWSVGWLSLILIGVAIGVVGRFWQIVVSMVRVNRLVASSTEVEHEEWKADWSHACDAIGISHRVCLRETTDDIAPLACGLLRATVVFPRAAREWSSQRRRAAMLHELAHVRHRDVAVILLGQIVCSVFFYHPLAWLAAKRMRHECERACDDRVLNAGYSASSYASHLTAITRSLANHWRPAALAMAMAQSSKIERRVRAILNDHQRRSQLGRLGGWLSITCSVVTALAIGAPQFSNAYGETELADGRISASQSNPDHTANRNSVFVMNEPPFTWNIASDKNVRWSQPLGSVTMSSPVVHGGRVFIGTNNDGGRIERLDKEQDMGCLLAFDTDTGKFLWQYAATKMSTGRVNDWPKFGITASPYADAGRVWIVNNRSEVVCLDAEGFHDNENDGRVQNEVFARDEADVIWSFSLVDELGSFPHNHSDCTITSDGRFLFIVVPNGVDETHRRLPNRNAPAFVALDRDTGKLAWASTITSDGILHGQWSSAALVSVDGQTQVVCPGGDGWLYSLNAQDGSLIWKFDCNPKESRWELAGRGGRNNLIGMPLVYNDLVYIATGQDPEHGEGNGDLWCINPSGRGDVSPQILDGDKLVVNPNSKAVWHSREIQRSISTPAAKDGLLVASDVTGRVHCFDAKTGQRHWTHDLFAGCWSSPIIVNDHIYIADEDGDVAILTLSTQALPAEEISIDSSVHGTPTVANNVLFIASDNRLYAIQNEASSDAE